MNAAQECLGLGRLLKKIHSSLPVEETYCGENQKAQPPEPQEQKKTLHTECPSGVASFWELDPDPVTDPHQSGKLDPDMDSLESEKLDPHQREKVEALEGHFWSIGGSKSGKKLVVGSGSASN